MDASRRPGSPEAHPDGASCAGLAALAAALACLDRPVSTFAVGLSGGPDSVALACCAAQHARTHRLSLHFFHVDHGLHAQAATWTRTAEQVGRLLDVPVHVARVHVDLASGEGIEAAARHARYQALADLSRQHGASPVLLAHHQDDQVETILHRLLRGSGVEGMRGMQASVDTEGARFLRPWLGLPRAVLIGSAQAWAAHHGIALADDPSNLDARYARGALRRGVLPAIAAHWPGYRATLTRFAQHAQTAAAVLLEVAASDLAQIAEQHDDLGSSLRLSGLLALSEARQTLVVRAWLASLQLAMPSDARLQALIIQLRASRLDRQLAWSHQGCTVRRYRDWVVVQQLAPAHANAIHVPPAVKSVSLQWQGQDALRVDAFAGVLHAHTAEQGIDPAWLRSGQLVLRLRGGGERLQIRADGPSRSLKNLYQEAGIPGWARDALPLVYRDDQLIYAAGLGTAADLPLSQPGIRLVWAPDLHTVVLHA
jgi:tRNA(Ile)-lysidine synthase